VCKSETDKCVFVQSKASRAKEGSQRGGSESGVSSAFLTQRLDQATTTNAHHAYKMAETALLSASTDQRVCLWDLQGKALGKLRQGDRGKAQEWHFPLTIEMIVAARQEALEQSTKVLVPET